MHYASRLVCGMMYGCTVVVRLLWVHVLCDSLSAYVGYIQQVSTVMYILHTVHGGWGMMSPTGSCPPLPIVRMFDVCWPRTPHCM